MSHAPKSRSLTVYRLKDVAAPPEDYLHPEKVLERISLTLPPGTAALLAVQRTARDKPRWADFFKNYVSLSVFGRVSSSSAVLLLPVGSAWYAVAFGQGRYLLRQESLVEGFGLRVALNSIAEEGIRSLDKETFDTLASQARQQASRDVAAGEFRLDTERDLLRAVTGTPDDPEIAQRLTGKDALGISAHVALDSLVVRLRIVDDLYAKSTYAERFPWVDQIRPVTEPGVIAALEGRLLASIKEGDLTRTWLAAPDILDWSEVRFFSYQYPPRAELIDVHWTTFLASVRSELTLSLLRSRRIYCVGDDDKVLGQWSVFKCIYGEVETAEGSYVLSAGRWFKIDRTLVADVDAYVASIEFLPDLLPLYDDDSETVYNRRAAAESGGHYSLLDGDLIPYGGLVSKVEVCDLLGANGDLVHIKRYSGSRNLSHLFMQGFVSAELLHLEDGFRNLALEKLEGDHHALLARFQPHRHRIVFGIISKSRGALRLPLFSRIVLRYTCKRLRGYNYRVALTKIGMEETRAHLKRIRPRRARRRVEK